MSIDHEPGTAESNDQQRVEIQAIEWLAKLRRPEISDAEQATFAIWLGADHSHRQLFDELLGVWDLSGQLRSRVTSRRTGERWPWITAATTVLLALSFWTLAPDKDRYQTATGEQIVVDLEDGSRLQINTETALQVDLMDKLRHVDLLQGEFFYSLS